MNRQGPESLQLSTNTGGIRAGEEEKEGERQKAEHIGIKVNSLSYLLLAV